MFVFKKQKMETYILFYNFLNLIYYKWIHVINITEYLQ